MSDYSEDGLVEQPAIQLFGELGWETVNATDEMLGAEGTLGRDVKGEVILGARLRSKVQRLNSGFPEVAINAAIDEVSRDRSATTPESANRELWGLMRDGVKVSIPDHEKGGVKTERVQLIDWNNPANNEFLLVSQMTITGPLYTCRPDLIGFVNGIPWVVIELKRPGVSARNGFDENLTSYKHAQNGIPALFWSNALLIASNGTESRVGSLTAEWERFFEWKRIEREDEPRRVSLEVMLRGLCEPSRLLDMVENYTLFSEHKQGLTKIIGQNHQFLGVNNAIDATLNARDEGHGRGGVFWQTQGSGKSFSMVFFAQKILRKHPGNWTFVIITDRVELDEQIARTFAACGAVTDANACHASSGVHLRELLSGNNRYVFTLIHKFQDDAVLCDRKDVIVLTDEAHRSQYDTLAMNMRAALPNATFVAFTGTPLIAGEERTREVFGDYVSIYDFQQSIEDGATVPLFYENRTPELHLDNPDLNDDIYALIEEAELDAEAEKKLERELGRQYHLITRDDRLDTVSQDIVRHFLARGFQGKGMVVAIDKATALRMYDKVRRCWDVELKQVEADLAVMTLDNPLIDELRIKVDLMKETDMAVVVSPGQNEIEQMAGVGVDIVPHRKRMLDEKLDEKFKDANDPLRLVFVCAMWLTGFDAPSVSSIYLDKPMRNHTLMQAIARANRVYPGKQSGLIVDYANVFVSLEKALAIYGQGGGGSMPVRDKQELADALSETLTALDGFCSQNGVSLTEVEATPTANFARIGAINEAADRLMNPEDIKRAYLTQAALVNSLYRAVKPHPLASRFAQRCGCVAAIADQIKNVTDPPDISIIMQGIQELLDESIGADKFTIKEPSSPMHGKIDLSKIDFAALKNRFKEKKPSNTDLERLKAAVRVQLEQMVRVNRTRADYLEKFRQLIDSYNTGSRNIEEVFKELLSLSNILTEEQSRHVRENLSEEELTVMDILTRPAPKLTSEERDEVKKVAHLLLEKLRGLLVIGWRQRVTSRARVRMAIEDALDEGLPVPYDKDEYERKCTAVFEHVYESYQGDGKSVFSEAA
ncbi:type I restriction endonuclease subunit R [Mariprofundus sp. KV]|uniref:type I restriction endonuclease subunit R n=1 Tax=Mariprofundus sp. KV TaxID=2608715 RepID=UPI0015A41658|nr:type I restriction endonuclease subunit R [Mariprofundus sp. KV]NWF36664.1 type I restriction endonuclease subunit R [Mariprofundus sp. KV]